MTGLLMFSTTQVAGLTTTQVQALTTDQVRGFFPGIFVALTTTEVVAFTTTQCGAIHPQVVGAMRVTATTQLSAMGTTQVLALTSNLGATNLCKFPTGSESFHATTTTSLNSFTDYTHIAPLAFVGDQGLELEMLAVNPTATLAANVAGWVFVSKDLGATYKVHASTTITTQTTTSVNGLTPAAVKAVDGTTVLASAATMKFSRGDLIGVASGTTVQTEWVAQSVGYEKS